MVASLEASPKTALRFISCLPACLPASQLNRARADLPSADTAVFYEQQGWHVQLRALLPAEEKAHQPHLCSDTESITCGPIQLVLQYMSPRARTSGGVQGFGSRLKIKISEFLNS